MDLNNSHVLDYTYPEHHHDAGLWFKVLYYGVAIPVSYIGNLFTYIIVCKLLWYRDSTSDVLVGGLALNDVLTAIIVFTPSLISAARGRYFSSTTMCEFSAVTTVWYIYTTFALIVLINTERWLAITKPFFYKRLSVTGFKLKAIIGVLGFFCLMMASIPLLKYPVVLKAGWYCAPAHITYIDIAPPENLYTSLTSTNPNVTRNVSLSTSIATSSSARDVAEVRPVQETIYIKLIFLVLGIFLLVGCNVNIAYTLKKRPFGDAASREADRKFSRIMCVVACLFLFTWLPNLTAQAVCLIKSPVCQRFEFWAMRIVNIGVAVNPFVYGVMKTTYRRGYLYLVRVSLHYLTFTLIPLPSYGEEIFDLRDRTRFSNKTRQHSITTKDQDPASAKSTCSASTPSPSSANEPQLLDEIKCPSTQPNGTVSVNKNEQTVQASPQKTAPEKTPEESYVCDIFLCSESGYAATTGGNHSRF